MSQTYSPALPRGKDGDAKVTYPPAKVALAATHRDAATASSVLVFTHDTTEIEVTATGGPIAIKWADITNNGTSVIAAAGTANFDHVVPASTTRRFVVPIQSFNPTASIQGVNRAEGLFRGVATIIAGPVASVLTTQY